MIKFTAMLAQTGIIVPLRIELKNKKSPAAKKCYRATEEIIFPLFYEGSVCQIGGTIFHASKLRTSVGHLLQLYEVVLDTICVHLLENHLKVHHTTLAEYSAILDMKHLDAILVFLHILHGVVLSHDCPINVHLEIDL